MITEGGPAMHSFPARRAAKALTGLVVAAGLALAADPPGQAASTGEGEPVTQIFSQKLPNAPGKPLTVVQVDSRPGGFSAPPRHPASGFVFAYVLSGTIRSQVEGEPLGVYSAGKTWTEPPNSNHIVSANASRTKPARLIAYIIADDGAEVTSYDKGSRDESPQSELRGSAMRILIAGASGAIGRALVRRLRANQHAGGR